ncbi:MAG: hypothetical protein KAU20_02250 [Nanoarchaeota archaeon]|nr:hypothetical protein [Nanoarchaeota archaeon]
MTKPAEFPDWALNNVTSPVSGQPNVSEPSTAAKNLGFDFKQFPPRQWINWLFRYIGQWIHWLDDNFEELIEGDILCTYHDDDDGSPYNQPEFNCHWIKDVKKNLLFFRIQDHTVTKLITTTTTLRIRPKTGNFPSEIIPTDTNQFYVPVLFHYVKFGVAGNKTVSGALMFENNFAVTDPIYVCTWDNPLVLVNFHLTPFGFDTNGNVIFRNQQLMWSLL